MFEPKQTPGDRIADELHRRGMSLRRLVQAVNDRRWLPEEEYMTRDDLVDLIAALFNPATYRTLVKERGWPIEKYERWMFEIVKSLFLSDFESFDRAGSSDSGSVPADN